jgi:hypothetical protein
MSELKNFGEERLAQKQEGGMKESPHSMLKAR